MLGLVIEEEEVYTQSPSKYNNYLLLYYSPVVKYYNTNYQLLYLNMQLHHNQVSNITTDHVIFM